MYPRWRIGKVLRYPPPKQLKQAHSISLLCQQQRRNRAHGITWWSAFSAEAASRSSPPPRHIQRQTLITEFFSTNARWPATSPFEKQRQRQLSDNVYEEFLLEAQLNRYRTPPVHALHITAFTGSGNASAYAIASRTNTYTVAVQRQWSHRTTAAALSDVLDQYS